MFTFTIFSYYENDIYTHEAWNLMIDVYKCVFNGKK